MEGFFAISAFMNTNLPLKSKELQERLWDSGGEVGVCTVL
jgi:hypothetical protein